MVPPKRVREHWDVFEEMQRRISEGVTPHAAAVKVAKERWRGVSKNEDACVQWLKDNQRKFLAELDPMRARFKQIETARLERLKNLSPHERERELEHNERELRHLEGMRENTLRERKKEDPKELWKQQRAEAKEKARLKAWHEKIERDPKAALKDLVELVLELNSYFYQLDADFSKLSTKIAENNG